MGCLQGAGGRRRPWGSCRGRPWPGRPELGAMPSLARWVGGALLMRVWGGGSHRPCTDSGADAESDAGTRAPTTVHAPQLHGHSGPRRASHGWGRSRGHRRAGRWGSERGWPWCVRPDAESAAGGGAGLALQGSHAAGRARRGAERCFAPTQPEQRDRTAPPSPRDSCTRLPTSPRNRVPGSRGVPRPQLLAWAAPPEGAPAVTARCVPVPESPCPRRKAARPPGERLRCSGKEQRPRVANRPVRPGPRLNVRQSK